MIVAEKFDGSIDLERNTIFNLSKITGSSYYNNDLSMDLKIQTVDSNKNINCGNILIRGGLGYNSTVVDEGKLSQCGEVHIYAGLDELDNDYTNVPTYLHVTPYDIRVKAYRNIELNAKNTLNVTSGVVKGVIIDDTTKSTIKYNDETLIEFNPEKYTVYPDSLRIIPNNLYIGDFDKSTTNINITGPVDSETQNNLSITSNNGGKVQASTISAIDKLEFKKDFMIYWDNKKNSVVFAKV